MFDPHKEFASLPKGRIGYSDLNRLLSDIEWRCRQDMPDNSDGQHWRPVAREMLWEQAIASGWVIGIDGGCFEVQDPRTPEAPDV